MSIISNNVYVCEWQWSILCIIDTQSRQLQKKETFFVCYVGVSFQFTNMAEIFMMKICALCDPLFEAKQNQLESPFAYGIFLSFKRRLNVWIKKRNWKEMNCHRFMCILYNVQG